MIEESEFQIDRNRLDDEWVRQVPLRNKYGELAAEARKKYTESKNDFSVVEAELYLDIAKNPGKYGLEKTTENSIKSAVTTNKRRNAAHDDMVRAKYELDIWESACKALDDRKSALPDLVKLFLAEYFAKPESPESHVAKEFIETAQAKRAFKPVKRRIKSEQ
jgi:hypothetical protein